MNDKTIDYLLKLIAISPLSSESTYEFGRRLMMLNHICGRKKTVFMEAYQNMVKTAVEVSRGSRTILDAVEECLQQLKKIDDPIAIATIQAIENHFQNLAENPPVSLKKFECPELEKELENFCTELGMKN